MANLPFLPEEGEGLDLKSGRFRSKKTGRYTRRVDLENIVAAIKGIFTEVTSISEKTTELVKSAELIQSSFDEIGTSLLPLIEKRSAEKDKQAEQEEKPKVQPLQKLGSTGFLGNAIKFAALLALLRSDRIKAIVSGFFDGLIEHVGVSKEAVAKLKLAGKALLGAFKLYFAYKVFKSVHDAFVAFKNLATAVGLLAVKTNAEGQKLSMREMLVEKKQKVVDNITKAYRNTKRFFKRIYIKGLRFIRFIKSKDRIIKLFKSKVTLIKDTVMRVAKMVTTTVRNVIKVVKTVKSFKRFKELLLTGLKTIRTVVNLAKVPTALATFGLSYLIGSVVDAGISTILDYYFAKEINDKSPDPAQTAGMFAKNIISSLTLGFVSGEGIQNTVTAAARKLFSWFDKAWSLFAGDDKKKEQNQAELVKRQSVGPSVQQIAKEFSPGLSKEEFIKQYDKKYLAARTILSRDVITKAESQREEVWNEYLRIAPPAVNERREQPARTEVSTNTLSGMNTLSAEPVSQPTISNNAPATSAVTVSAESVEPQSMGMSAPPPSSFAPEQASSPTAAKEVSVASLSEEVSLDKKKQKQEAAMGGTTIVNNQNITNMIVPQQKPDINVTPMLYSDTVGS